VNCKHSLPRCDNDFRQRKPINNPAACLSPAILSSEFSSIQGVGSMGGRRWLDPRIVDRINRQIATMISIISMLSFLYTTLEFIHYAFIDISSSHSVNSFVLFTCHLFESSHDSAALLLLLHLLPAPGAANDLSTTRIWRTISARYPRIRMIIEMAIQIPLRSLFGDHPGK